MWREGTKGRREGRKGGRERDKYVGYVCMFRGKKGRNDGEEEV